VRRFLFLDGLRKAERKAALGRPGRGWDVNITTRVREM